MELRLFNDLVRAIRAADDNAAVGSSKVRNRWQRSSGSILTGMGIVSMVAVVEHRLGKDPNKQWRLPGGWMGKEEFNNLRQIRHCFAHADGRILPGLERKLKYFYAKLVKGEVRNARGERIMPYYRLERGRVKLDLSALDRAKRLCLDCMSEAGVI